MPCFGIVMILLGRRAFSGSPAGMLALETVCSLFFAVGLILAAIAFFAPKGAETGSMGQAIAGICINGLLISITILSIFTRQKVAASENNTPDPPRKTWSYISGK